MKPLVLTLAAGLLLGACATPPVQDAGPLPYAAAVAARFPAPRGIRYATPAFGRDEGFTRNEEVAAWLRRLAAPGAATRGTKVELLALGASQGGTPIEALRLTGAPGTGALPRPVVLLVAQQHGDEPAGSEAALVIAEQLANGPLERLLERIDVIVLPRANPDGAALQRRVTDNGIDANRDHLLLRTPEARAQAQLMAQFRPAVVIDAHEHTVVGRYLEKFAGAQRNDMLLQYAMTANLPAPITQASEAWFRQPLVAALAREGLTSEWYYTNSTAPGDLRISMGGVQPDTGRNVNGLKNTVSILLESRGVGIGRLHFTRRVHSQVVAQRSILDGQTAGQRELVFLDPQTGADKPVGVEWFSSLELRSLRERPRPCGYWLAADAEDAVQRLRALGVEVRRLVAPVELQAEGWRETARSESARPDVRGSAADAGASIVNVEVALEPARRSAPAGSFYVPLDQPLANLVIAALEPDTQNSYFANRVLPALDSAARVMAKF